MTTGREGPHETDAADAVRLALRGWQQRVQAVIEIARDDDDLVVRLPVLEALATELVRDLRVANDGLVAASMRLPSEADALAAAVTRALAILEPIELWHRPPSVVALRKARDYFRVAADRLDA